VASRGAAARGRPPQQAAPDHAYAAYLAALGAAPLADRGGSDVGQGSREREDADDPFADNPFARYLDRLAERDDPPGALDREVAAELSAMTQAGGASYTGVAGAGSRAGSDGRGFNERVSEEARTGAYVQAELVEPASPYEVKAGSVIPAILVTGLSSELPGDVVAQVSRDVYDTQQQRHLVIPRGSRLLGRYDSDVAFGQDRALVAWTRLVLPDGRSLALPGFNAVEGSGMVGLQDHVDRHLLAAFGSAGAIAVLGAGVQLAAQGASGGSFGDDDAPSPSDIVAAQVALEVSRVATGILERHLDRAPTITVRPGFRFNVFVNRDVALPSPYRERGTDARFVPSPEAPPPHAPHPVMPGSQGPVSGVVFPGGSALVRRPDGP
jgi:type IV secretion system protein VirB10